MYNKHTNHTSTYAPSFARLCILILLAIRWKHASVSSAVTLAVATPGHGIGHLHLFRLAFGEECNEFLRLKQCLKRCLKQCKCQFQGCLSNEDPQFLREVMNQSQHFTGTKLNQVEPSNSSKCLTWLTYPIPCCEHWTSMRCLGHENSQRPPSPSTVPRNSVRRK